MVKNERLPPDASLRSCFRVFDLHVTHSTPPKRLRVLGQPKLLIVVRRGKNAKVTGKNH